jgi:transposase
VFQLDQAANKVDLPTYSPDMNRPIEHVFAYVKQQARMHIYRSEKDFSKGEELQLMLVKVFRVPQAWGCA